MPITYDNVGEWSPEVTYEVKTEAIRKYVDATNDPNPEYREGVDSIAPPLFAIVAGWDALAAATGETITPDLYARVVHLIQDMRMKRPIRAGDILRVQAQAAGVKGGRKGTSVVLRATVKDEDSDVIQEFWTTFYIVGHGEATDTGEASPEIGGPHADDPVAVVEHHLDMDQTYRYAEASGDHNPIHIDEDFAKSVGHPGIIIHGMCTLAFAAKAAVEELCKGDPRRMRRFAGRFSKVVRPGQLLRTTFWEADDRRGETIYRFETSTDDGVVIKDGLVEVADPIDYSRPEG